MGDHFVSASEVFPELDFDLPSPAQPAPAAKTFATIDHQPQQITFSDGAISGTVLNALQASIDVPDLPASVMDYYQPGDFFEGFPEGTTAFTLRGTATTVPEPSSLVALIGMATAGALGCVLRRRQRSA
jgi:hypothetical protein